MSKDPREPIGYYVYRSTDPELPLKQWDRITETPIPDTNFTDKALEPDTKYYYYVTAVNALGIESGPSEIISVRTKATDEVRKDQITESEQPTIKLPKKLNPSPITETVVEIRFNSTLPADATFGVVYNVLKESYSNVEYLPILQIPEAVRIQDTNLTYQPHYKLTNNNFILQVGPKVISLAVAAPYPGWETYFAELRRVFEIIRGLGFITSISRVAIRYIDFFLTDIFEHINLVVTLNGQKATTTQTFFRTVLEKGQFECLLQIGNQVNMKQSNGIIEIGSVIDIDTSLKEGSDKFFDNIDSILQEAHTAQKELFFSLLKQEFLTSLNPTY